jgi:hypothetical protein
VADWGAVERDLSLTEGVTRLDELVGPSPDSVADPTTDSIRTLPTDSDPEPPVDPSVEFFFSEARTVGGDDLTVLIPAKAAGRERARPRLRGMDPLLLRELLSLSLSLSLLLPGRDRRYSGWRMSQQLRRALRPMTT